jgi:hypothetical protein
VNVLGFESLFVHVLFVSVCVFGFRSSELGVGVVQLTKSGGVLGAFLRGISSKIGTVRGTTGFDLFDVFIGKAGVVFGRSFCGGLVLFLRALVFDSLFLFFFFFEDGAADEGVSPRLSGSFLVLGFDEICGQGSDLIFAQLGTVVFRFGFVSGLRGCRFGLGCDGLRRSFGLRSCFR